MSEIFHNTCSPAIKFYEDIHENYENLERSIKNFWDIYLHSAKNFTALWEQEDQNSCAGNKR